MPGLSMIVPSRGLAMARCVRRGYVLLLVSVLALAGPAWAGTTGKLVGRVVDDKGAPLASVNVRVEGQRLGAVTDDQGRYFVIGVQAGSYTVLANLLGYRPFTAEHVSIAPDFTTTLDITLHTEAVPMAEVKVEAERPLLQKDATGTTRFIEAKDLQQMPVRGYRDAAALQSGVISYLRQPNLLFENATTDQPSLVVRGGRPNETAYFVDGFSQQDPLTGTSSTAISNNAIEEVVVLTGGFNPEYGRIMSGAVNVVTREGTGRYSGALETISDNLAGNWIAAPRTDYNVYDGSIGGPVLPGHDNVTFYLSGERRWERDRNPSALSDVFRQQLRSGTDYGVDAKGNPILPGQRYRDDIKPNNSSSVYTLQGKLAWRLNDRMTLRAGGLGSDDDWHEYVHSLLFNPSFMPRHYDGNRSYYGSFNHALSARTFYNIGINYLEALSKTGNGTTFDNLTEAGRAYRDTSTNTLDLDLPMFTLPSPPGGAGAYANFAYQQRRSAYVGLQGSWTSQLTTHHQLKVGGDFERHTLRQITIYQPFTFGGPHPDFKDINGYGYRVVIDYDANGKFKSARLVDENSGRDGAKHPRTFSLYAQDKFEREGLIVNGGLRLDYLNVDTPALRSDRYPLGPPGDPNNLPDSLEAQDLETNHTYTRISPRFGAAFPVDERTILRFNYGQFFQQPNLRDLYVSYRFLQYLLRTHPYYIPLGNPNLRPERTTAFEAGVQRQLADRVRLDLTAYYKDVKDLVEIVSIPNSSVSSYHNRDFATIKGVDVGFTLRPVHHVGANVAYSLSSAMGTGSSSNDQFRIAWLGGNVPKITAPLAFDQRHKLSLGVDVGLEHGEGPVWRGMQRPLQDSHVNVVLNVASGTPFTPTVIYNEVGQLVTAPRPIAPLNSRYGPWTSSLDVKASRAFPVRGYRMEAYVWALNVLNARNAIDVYHSSGSPTSTGWLATSDGQAYQQTAQQKGADGAALYQLAENNPTMFTNPRLVRFGLRTSF
jgi:outer membrane receptor protein involved in Fe transport